MNKQSHHEGTGEERLGQGQVRRVSFVDRLQFRWKHRTFQKAVVIGDMDNDGITELAVGSIGGVILIWKGTNPIPWRTCDNLGTITVLAVGDIYNQDKNVLLVATAEGRCHIFDCTAEKSKGEEGTAQDIVTIEPFATHRIPTNSTAVLIADYDNDKMNEVIFGTSEGSVYAIQFSFAIPQMDSGRRSYSSSVEQSTKREKGQWRLSLGVNSLSLCKAEEESVIVAGLKDGNFAVLASYNTVQPTTEFEWKDAGSGGGGGGSTIYERDREVLNEEKEGKEKGKEKEEKSLIEFERESDGEPYYGMGEDLVESLFLPTEAVTPVTRSKIPLMAVATLDGPVELRGLHLTHRLLTWNAQKERREARPTEDLMNNDDILSTEFLATQTLMDTVLWQFDADDQIFAMGAIDITGDGEQEVVACSWDGTTYIFNHKKEMVKFEFGNPVCAFCVGAYTIGGREVPCFVYVSQEGYIWLYYNVKLRSLSIITATALLRDDLRDYTSLQKNVDSSGEWDDEEQRELIHSCLYHFPPEEEVNKYISSLKEKIKTLKAAKAASAEGGTISNE